MLTGRTRILPISRHLPSWELNSWPIYLIKRYCSSLIHETNIFPGDDSGRVSAEAVVFDWARLVYSICIRLNDAYPICSLLLLCPFQPCLHSDPKSSDAFMSACAETTRIPYSPFITLDRGQNATTMFLVSIDQPGSPLPWMQTDNRLSNARIMNNQLFSCTDNARLVEAKRSPERGKASLAKSLVILITRAQFPVFPVSNGLQSLLSLVDAALD